jgi:NAD(P)-dependent dehydrogenase (short-subunit alcohol dehydrogenase family)
VGRRHTGDRQLNYHLQGKSAFVVAGAHGIGEAIADLLVQEGAVVVVADQDELALRHKSTKWKGTVHADLSTAEGVDRSVARALETFDGPPDILINNLGVADAAPFAQISDEQWARSFQVNVMGCVRACRALVPKMAERGSGSVVNTGSDLAKQPEPGLMDYGACKASLLYITKALAKEYAPKVRVNAVLPGPIWSRMWTRDGGLVDQLMRHYGLDREASVKKFLEERQMPMGIGDPADVAHAVVFLASPLAKFITGASLDIGGTIRGIL